MSFPPPCLRQVTIRGSSSLLFPIAMFSLLLQIQAEEPPLNISLSNRGVVINAGAAGKFTLPVPALDLGDSKSEQPSITLENETNAVAQYPGGTQLRLEISPGQRSATYSFADLPQNARAFVFSVRVPLTFKEGGLFAIGKKETPFPQEMEGRYVAEDSAASFAMWGPMGGGFRMNAPQDNHKMQDNRSLGGKAFIYLYSYNFSAHEGNAQFVLRFEEPGAAAKMPDRAKPRILVDRYGQSALKDFPNKVKSDEELKADGTNQKAALSPLGGPALDVYGGLAGSGAKYGLKKTGFFHVGEAGGRQVLVTPEGNAFIHLGVCGITLADSQTLVTSRENVYEWLPPKDGEFAGAWREDTPGVFSFHAANWMRKFGKPFSLEEWTGQVAERLRSWGFNSGGAFSATSDAMRKLNFPYVRTLPARKEDGIPVLPDILGAGHVLDPFTPGAEAILERVLAEKVLPYAKDPLLIGWFQGNEQHFEMIPNRVAGYRSSRVPAKARLVAMLREKYGEDIAKFNAAWMPAQPFKNFDDLNEEPLFNRSPAAAADLKEFFGLYLEAYYAMMTRALRKYDTNHLLIGNRFTPHTANTEDVVRIAGKYLDVLSINYYTYPIEKEFLRKVHEWSGGRPLILSEWYYSSTEAGLGATHELAGQEERGKAYRHYAEQAISLPFVVGSEWFIYTDQALTGRFFEGLNGEGNNTGLVNVADRPYEALIAATRQTGESIYKVAFGTKPPFVFDDPRFTGENAVALRKSLAIPKAPPGMKLAGSTGHWPGRSAEPIEPRRVVAGAPDSRLSGDFRICWNEDHLYFLIQVKDPTPGQNENDPASLWRGDSVELFIGAKEPDKGGAPKPDDRQILLGAGRKPLVFMANSNASAEACELTVIPNIAGDGYLLEAAIPWATLGITPSAAMDLLFDVTINNSDDGTTRIQQLAWNGTAKNSRDRGAWGRLRLRDN